MTSKAKAALLFSIVVIAAISFFGGVIYTTAMNEPVTTKERGEQTEKRGEQTEVRWFPVECKSENYRCLAYTKNRASDVDTIHVDIVRAKDEEPELTEEQKRLWGQE